MNLFVKTLHEPLTKSNWSKQRAQDFIGFLSEQASSTFDENTLWPSHPNQLDAYKMTSPGASLWLGATGTIIALTELHKNNNELSLRDYSTTMQRFWPIEQRSLAEFDQVYSCDRASPGYLMGESSINWLAYQLTNDDKYLEYLYINIKDNTNNPAKEFMWGGAGTMLVAIFAFNKTKDRKWIDLFKKSADYFFETWQTPDFCNLPLWHQEISGIKAYIVGLIHGFAGNVFALMKGFDWLSSEQQTRLLEDGLQLLADTAIQDKKFANWLPCVGPAWEGSDTPFLQICHGAPSMILSYANFWPYMDKNTKELMLKGAELTWHAGPLKKPWGLCHGTAGNGWTFLKTARLSDNEVWITRARAFAMHAIEQSEAMYQQYGQIRSDYWCGDLGLAIYLQACLNETDELLTLDYF